MRIIRPGSTEKANIEKRYQVFLKLRTKLSGPGIFLNAAARHSYANEFLVENSTVVVASKEEPSEEEAEGDNLHTQALDPAQNIALSGLEYTG
jgi:hypothetical protein